MSLSQEEIDACHEAFREVDVGRRGHINVWELRIVLQGRRSNKSYATACAKSISLPYRSLNVPGQMISVPWRSSSSTIAPQHKGP